MRLSSYQAAPSRWLRQGCQFDYRDGVRILLVLALSQSSIESDEKQLQMPSPCCRNRGRIHAEGAPLLHMNPLKPDDGEIIQAICSSARLVLPIGIIISNLDDIPMQLEDGETKEALEGAKEAMEEIDAVIERLKEIRSDVGKWLASAGGITGFN